MRSQDEDNKLRREDKGQGGTMMLNRINEHKTLLGVKKANFTVKADFYISYLIFLKTNHLAVSDLIIFNCFPFKIYTVFDISHSDWRKMVSQR